MNILYTIFFVYGTGMICSLATIFIECLLPRPTSFKGKDIPAIILLSWLYPLFRIAQAFQRLLSYYRSHKK